MGATGTAQPSRALEPVKTGRVELRGVGIAYETFGEGEETIVLLPPWSIIHSRFCVSVKTPSITFTFTNGISPPPD